MFSIYMPEIDKCVTMYHDKQSLLFKHSVVKLIHSINYLYVGDFQADSVIFLTTSMIMFVPMKKMPATVQTTLSMTTVGYSK